MAPAVSDITNERVCFWCFGEGRGADYGQFLLSANGKISVAMRNNIYHMRVG